MAENIPIADQITLECIIEAMSQTIPKNKDRLLKEFMVLYDIKMKDIPNRYSEFVDFLRKKLPSAQYYRIIRLIIHILHERASQGRYKETNAIEAFTRIVEVNMQKTVEYQKASLARSKNSTQIKHLRQVIRDKDLKLKSAERLSTIGQTAGMIGHDIRNPLQSILGEVYLAKDELTAIQDCTSKKKPTR